MKILTQYGCLQYFSELAKSTKSEEIKIEAEEVIKLLLTASHDEVFNTKAKK